jgi:hypothetical protein
MSRCMHRCLLRYTARTVRGSTLSPTLQDLVVFEASFASKGSSNDSGATIHDVKPLSMVLS